MEMLTQSLHFGEHGVLVEVVPSSCRWPRGARELPVQLSALWGLLFSSQVSPGRPLAQLGKAAQTGPSGGVRCAAWTGCRAQPGRLTGFIALQGCPGLLSTRPS